MPNKKKILFLMSDTGGGHRASAMAIKEAIDLLFPARYDVIIEDVWKNHMPWPIKTLPDFYPWLIGPGKPLWEALWKMSTNRKVQTGIFHCTSPLIKGRVGHYINQHQPDLVVSVHPLMNYLGLEWVKASGKQVPFVTVVTDMVTLHSSWICPEVDRCFVSTEEARDQALEHGMPAEKITVHGQPVAMKFATMAEDRLSIKQTLGVDPCSPALLLVAGGEGHLYLYTMAKKLAQRVEGIQLLVIAGRNKKLQKKLAQVKWPFPVQVFGFVDNMPELMAAADLLVTKAGPGTISEAFIAGLPLILSDFIPGQEEGNVSYVSEHGAGLYLPVLDDLVDFVADWVSGENTAVAEMARNAAGLARPQASLAIAEDLCALLEASPSSSSSPA